MLGGCTELPCDLRVTARKLRRGRFRWLHSRLFSRCFLLYGICLCLGNGRRLACCLLLIGERYISRLLFNGCSCSCRRLTILFSSCLGVSLCRCRSSTCSIRRRSLCRRSHRLTSGSPGRFCRSTLCFALCCSFSCLLLGFSLSLLFLLLQLTKRGHAGGSRRKRTSVRAYALLLILFSCRCFLPEYTEGMVLVVRGVL